VIDLGRILSKNPNAAYRIYDGQATIVLSDRAEVNVINEIGTLVWDRIDGKRSLAEILEAVLAEYEVGPDEARRDVLEFVASLHERGMVS
jgi:coenzyme PQQ synthesis protein D (PqqD)